MEDLVYYSDYFYCDETSPSGLRWKVDRYCGRNYSVLVAAKNDVAGCKGSDGYFRVKLHNKGLLCHRILLEILGMDLTDKFVDHKNGDTSDNHFENLRVITRILNSRNVSKRKNNTSGTTGVSFLSIKNNYYWCARWSDAGGKEKAKLFKASCYNDVDAKMLAITFREDKLEELRNKNYGYSEDHGVRLSK